MRIVEARAAALELAGAWNDALDHFRRGIAADDLAEILYQGEIRCLLALDRTGEARAALQRLERVLAARLGAAPSAAHAGTDRIDIVRSPTIRRDADPGRGFA